MSHNISLLLPHHQVGPNFDISQANETRHSDPIVTFGDSWGTFLELTNRRKSLEGTPLPGASDPLEEPLDSDVDAQSYR